MARILVLDDDAVMREVLRAMLEAAGHEVIDAADGEAGMEIYRTQPTDLIVTDMIMPEKTGMEAIAELKQEFPDVKIIAISGGGEKSGPYSYLMMAKRLGAKRILMKPIKHQELVEAVSEVLAGWE
jgi:CheY-like chemotaxis protein